MEQNTFFCKRSSLRSQTFLSVSQTCWDTLYLNFSAKIHNNYLAIFFFLSFGPKLGFFCLRLEKLVYLHFGGGTRRSILSLFVCGQHLMIVVRNSMSAWSISLDSRTLIFRFSRIKANRVVVKCTYKKPKSTLVNIVEQSKEKTKDLLIYI